MTELLRELEAVVGLAEKATPGEWLYRKGTAVVILGQGAGGFDLSDCPQPAENAQAIASAVNFLRTHHAEIAEALKDARRYRHIKSAPAGTVRADFNAWLPSYYPWGIGTRSLDEQIDAAMRNSEWEAGE